MPAHRYAVPGQDLPRHRTRKNERRREAAAEMAAAAHIGISVIADKGGVIGMGGAWAKGEVIIIARAGVGVLDEGAKGRAGSRAVFHT